MRAVDVSKVWALAQSLGLMVAAYMALAVSELLVELEVVVVEVARLQLVPAMMVMGP